MMKEGIDLKLAPIFYIFIFGEGPLLNFFFLNLMFEKEPFDLIFSYYELVSNYTACTFYFLSFRKVSHHYRSLLRH
jgi:hypothetical protein